MNDFQNGHDIDFTIDLNNLYREEAITDLRVASIRKMTPVKPDGSEDSSRTPIFFGSTQLMTPDGPLPIQSKLEANNMQEAYQVFPNAMQKALNEMIEKLEQMQKQRQAEQQKEKSRIIVPGR
jgi:hypothetical protein